MMYGEIFKYAEDKHKGQFRKNGVEEYINHPYRVSQIVKDYGGTVEQQCAALLHDVIEDTPTSINDLWCDLAHIYLPNKASEIETWRRSKQTKAQEWMLDCSAELKSIDYIVSYVDDLTNTFTKEAYPQLNRQKRQERSIKHFVKNADKASYIIKFADIIDNIGSIEKLEPDFAATYFCEDFQLVRVMKMDHPIYFKVVEVLKDAMSKLL